MNKQLKPTDKKLFMLEIKEKFKINENIVNNPQFEKIINSLNLSIDYPKITSVRPYRIFSNNEPGVYVTSGEINTGHRTENGDLNYYITSYVIDKKQHFPGQKLTLAIGSLYPKFSFCYYNKNNHPSVRVEKKVNDTLKELSFYSGNKNKLYAKDFVQKTNENLYEHYYVISNNGRVYLGNCTNTKPNETFWKIQKRTGSFNIVAELLDENYPISDVVDIMENLKFLEIESIVKSKKERLEFLNELKSTPKRELA